MARLRHCGDNPLVKFCILEALNHCKSKLDSGQITVTADDLFGNCRMDGCESWNDYLLRVKVMILATQGVTIECTTCCEFEYVCDTYQNFGQISLVQLV